ncbi:MAG: hypothetical protein R2748_19630 [Bryobacterales bacterium]
MSWLTIAAIVAVGVTLDRRQGDEHWRAEFPGARFPKMVFVMRLGAPGEGARTQRPTNGDYLIYHLHPTITLSLMGAAISTTRRCVTTISR